MKGFLHGLMLFLFVSVLAYAIIIFGGAAVEFNAPLYILATLLVMAWAVKLLFLRQVSWLWSPMHIPVLAFAVYAAIRYFASPVEYDSRQEVLHVGLYSLIYLLVACNFYRTRHRNVLIISLAALACAEAAYALWQFTTASEKVLWLNTPYVGRGGGTYICPNHLAGFLEITLCVIVARVAIHRSSGTFVAEAAIHKFFASYVALFLMAGLFATLSRGGWLAISASLILFLLWASQTRAVSSRVIGTATVILIILGAVAWNVPAIHSRISDTVEVRFDYTFDYDAIKFTPSAHSDRKAMSMATLEMIRDNLYLGTGPGTWRWFHLKYRDPSLQFHPVYAHNDVLHLASDYGLIGFGLIALLLGCFFWHAARLSHPANSYDERAFAVGSAFAVVAILIHSFVDFNMHIPANALLVFTLFGLTSAISNGTSKRMEMKTLPRMFLGSALLLIAAWGAWAGVRMAAANWYSSLGTDAKEVLDWDNALRHYRRAMEWDPKFPEPHTKIGDIYRLQSAARSPESQESERKQLANMAIASYRKSLELNPFQSEVTLRLAAAYELTADMESALTAYQHAISVDPNNAFNYLQLGLFFRRIGDESRAAEAFKKSAQLGQFERTAQDNLEEIRGESRSTGTHN